MKEKIRPRPIWPIIASGIILIVLNASSMLISAGVLFGCTYLSIRVHMDNKKYFGNHYMTKPLPTKEAVKIFARHSMSLRQEYVEIALFFVGLIAGHFVFGLLGSLFFAFLLSIVANVIFKY